MNVGTDRKDNSQYKWFMWTLHIAVIEAFKEGRFSEVRFAYPKRYQKDASVFIFHNVESYIEDMLLDDGQALGNRRHRY